MPLITWILPDGSQRQADVPNGTHLMTAATSDNIPGIDGDCGGCLSCATCHVVVDDPWIDRVGRPGPEESAMLEAAPAPRQDGSRLSCQIVASPELDGLVVRIPQA